LRGCHALHFADGLALQTQNEKFLVGGTGVFSSDGAAECNDSAHFYFPCKVVAREIAASSCIS